MQKGGMRNGSGRKTIPGKEIKVKLPYDYINRLESFEGDSLAEKVREAIKAGLDYEIENYGVVYTPEFLSKFMAQILFDIASKYHSKMSSFRVFDPACGECSLLYGIKEVFNLSYNLELYGNDIDSHYKEKALSNNITFFSNDALFPSLGKSTFNYWKKKIGKIDIVIANPPWSTEKIYTNDILNKYNYEFYYGQYDVYTLFIELAYKIVAENGLIALILPDSLLTSDDSRIRKLLLNNTEVKFLARLGEKIFPNIHRSTVLIICQKKIPSYSSEISTFRLNTKNRNLVLNNQMSLYEIYKNNKNFIFQRDFLNDYIMSVDSTNKNRLLMDHLKDVSESAKKYFVFNKGAEISKSGNQVKCPQCMCVQGYLKNTINKKCISCGKDFKISDNISRVVYDNYQIGTEKLFVGESIQRYFLKEPKFIVLGQKGINYKDKSIYQGCKILIRKTGLGLKACIDENDTYFNQTVYSLNAIDKTIDNYFYLALFNSRVVFYYYLIKYGENEWKSHPYITKNIVYDLPFVKRELLDDGLVKKISTLSKELSNDYSLALDIELEKCIYKAYGLCDKDIEEIEDTINNLPDLGAINGMKIRSH